MSDLPPETVLNGAIEAQLAPVLVIGWGRDGELYAASSTDDKGEVLRLLERFKHKLLAGDYD